MSGTFDFYVGIDLATAGHQACLIDGVGKVIKEIAFEHSASGLDDFIRTVQRTTGISGARVGMALEAPRGPVIEFALDRGYAVFSINPKQLDRFRDRYSVAGAKDDRRDAFVLANSLRTDLELFRLLNQESTAQVRLRELSRLEDDLTQSHNGLVNQLREQLHRYFPQILQMSSAADDSWIWDLIEIAPRPEMACKLTRARIERLLKRHRIRRLTAEQVMTLLRSQPFKLAPGSTEAASEHVMFLIPHLRLIRQQSLDVASRIEKLLNELMISESDSGDVSTVHSQDVAIIRSLPGVGRVVTATLIAEASRAIADRDYASLRSFAGIAPITRQSGNKKIVVMRRGCNNRLRNAMYHWSRVSTVCDERSRSHYRRLRKKGQSHGTALRAIADCWLKTLMVMLRAQKSFDLQKWNPSAVNSVASPNESN